MKWTLLLVLPALVGCQSLNELQPGNLEYWRANERIVSITGAQEFTIKSPRKEIIQDGVVVGTEPVMDTNGQPLTFDFWIKDTSARPPKSLLDVVSAIPRAILAGIGIWKGIDGLVDLGKLNRTQSPLVIEVPGDTQVFAPKGPSGSLTRVN